MSGRRFLAAAGAAVVAVLLAATPAPAAEPTVQWTRPTVEDAVLRASGPITGTVRTQESDNQTIKGASFELVQQLDDPEDPCLVDTEGLEAKPSREEPKAPLDFKLAIEFPCNRVYRLKAHVTYDDPVVAGVALAPKTVEAAPVLDFKVAIPPAQVTGLKATYDPASKQVALTWKPNREVDLRGYRVLRNPPGPAGFETVAEVGRGATTFADAPIDVEHRYQVIAVREGPDGTPIEGRASAAVSAGPKAPQPTLPQVRSTPAQRRPTGTTAGGNRPTVRKRTVTTVDTGFSRDLPFDPSQTTTQVPTTTSEPEGEAAVLAEFDDGNDEDDRRATLVPIAGGLALLMSALHMRLLSKRLGDDDIPMLPGS